MQCSVWSALGAALLTEAVCSCFAPCWSIPSNQGLSSGLAGRDQCSLSPLVLPQGGFSCGGVEELFSHFANGGVEPLLSCPFPRSWRDNMYFTAPYLPVFFTGQSGIMSLIQLLFWAIIELIPSSWGYCLECKGSPWPTGSVCTARWNVRHRVTTHKAPDSLGTNSAA